MNGDTHWSTKPHLNLPGSCQWQHPLEHQTFIWTYLRAVNGNTWRSTILLDGFYHLQANIYPGADITSGLAFLYSVCLWQVHVTQGDTPAKKNCWITRKYPLVSYSKCTGTPESTHQWATQNLQDHQKVPLVGYLKMTLLVSHFWHSYDLGNWVIDQIYVNYHLHWISGKVTHGKYSERIIVVVVDHFYIALFSAGEQTQSTRMWFYMSD